MPLLAPSVLTVGLFILCISLTASAQVFTSVTGRDVPIRFIQEHFSKSLTSSDLDKADLLYEFTDDQVLLGPGLNIDLRKEARLVHVGTSPFLATLDLNGKRKEPVPAKIKILRARNYDVILDKDSGQVLSVSGNGIALTPLHQTTFPGILVNKRAFSKYGEHMSDDFNIIPQDADEISTNGTGVGVNFAAHQFGGSCASGTIHYLEIAAAYDNTFCSLYGNVEAVATAALQRVFDKANAPYARQTCVRLVLVHVEAHCADRKDPFASFPSKLKKRPCPQLDLLSGSRSCVASLIILDGFQKYWRTKRSNVRADVAYLFTGYDEGTSEAGRATIGGACNTGFGHGWVEGPDERTFAHELGHTLSGTHTSSGIMTAVYSRSDPFVFSGESVRRFTQFLDRERRSSCVATSKPKCDATCPGRCKNNKCVKPKPPPPGLVPCTPIKGFYKCTFTRDFLSTRYYFTEKCPKQYNFVQRKFDAKDASIFCCTSPKSSTQEEVVPSGTPTSTLNVRHRNGRIESFPTRLRDTSGLTTVKLMKSTLVPSCSRAGSPGPGPGVKSTTAPPAKRTCKAGFTRTRALACGTRSVGNLDIKKPGFSARIKVSLQQISGEFRVRYTTRGGADITRYRDLVTTADKKAADFLAASGKVVTTPRTKAVQTAWDAYSMPLAGETCCWKNLFIAAYFRVCRDQGLFKTCASGSKKFVALVRCRNYCLGRPPAAVLVPMSKAQKCPSCR